MTKSSIDMGYIVKFLVESNKIEGITEYPSVHVAEAFDGFLALDDFGLDALCVLVDVFQPGVKLRSNAGMDVRVGTHRPPPGGTSIPRTLEALLADVGANAIPPYLAHCEYEALHPFMDGNGRSGRALWAWQMCKFHNYDLKYSFLHIFYYQTLQNFNSLETVG